MTCTFFRNVLTGLVTVAMLDACHYDMTTPNRFDTIFDTVTFRSSLIIVDPTLSLKIGLWQTMTATVTSTNVDIYYIRVGGFKVSVDKPTMVVVISEPIFTSYVTSGVKIKQSFIIRAIGGAGQTVTVTICPEADLRLKKRFIITPFQVPVASFIAQLVATGRLSEFVITTP